MGHIVPEPKARYSELDSFFHYISTFLYLMVSHLLDFYTVVVWVY